MPSSTILLYQHHPLPSSIFDIHGRSEHAGRRLCSHILLLPMLDTTIDHIRLAQTSRRVIQKTRAYAKKKLWHRKKEKILESVRGRFQDSFDKFLEGSIEIQVDDFHGGHDYESCIEEVEEVLEGFSQKGEFAFGSFWGRVGSGTSPACIVAVQEFDLSFAQFEVVETISTSFRHSY